MSRSNMSTTSTSPTVDDEKESISELADEVAQTTDDPAVQQLAEATKELAARQGQTDDYVRIVIAEEVDDLGGRLDELEVSVSGLQATQSEHDHQLESFLGPSPGRTKRDKRLADIKGGMIRAAQALDRPGIAWHRYDIEEHLAGHNYTENDIPAKAQLRKDIVEIAREPGFEETKKKREGEDGIVREILAVKVVLNQLPEHVVSNHVTTPDGLGGRSEGAGSDHVHSDNR